MKESEEAQDNKYKHMKYKTATMYSILVSEK